MSEFKQLLERAGSGDNAALEAIVQEYQADLIRVARARLGASLRPYLDSVDLVQSVHKSILIGLRDNKFDLQSSEHLVNLAAMIVRRKVARLWRRQRRQQRLESRQSDQVDEASLLSLLVSLAKPTPDPAFELEREERWRGLLNQLDPVDRRAIQLRLEGYSTAEAARTLGLGSDMLRARLGRLRRRVLNSGLSSDWL